MDLFGVLLGNCEWLGGRIINMEELFILILMNNKFKSIKIKSMKCLLNIGVFRVTSLYSLKGLIDVTQRLCSKP